MLKNEYLVAKIGLDTAENEPAADMDRLYAACGWAGPLAAAGADFMKAPRETPSILSEKC